MPYQIPRKWPLEALPAHGFLWRYFLSNSVLMAIIAHYFHLQLLSSVVPIKQSIILDMNAMTFVANSSLGVILYNVVLIAITTMYATYFYDCFHEVQNKREYIYYGSMSIAKHVGILCACLYLTQISVLPFGGFYIAFLANSMGVHYDILQIVNLKGLE